MKPTTPENLPKCSQICQNHTGHFPWMSQISQVISYLTFQFLFPFGLTKPYDSTVEARHGHPRWVLWWPGSWFIGQRQRKFRRENESSGRNPFVVEVDINDTYQIPSIHLQHLFVGGTVSGLFRWFISIIIYNHIIIVGSMYIDCLFALVSASAYLPFFASICLYTRGKYVNTHTHTQTYSIQ